MWTKISLSFPLNASNVAFLSHGIAFIRSRRILGFASSIKYIITLFLSSVIFCLQLVIWHLSHTRIPTDKTNIANRHIRIFVFFFLLISKWRKSAGNDTIQPVVLFAWWARPTCDLENETFSDIWYVSVWPFDPRANYRYARFRKKRCMRACVTGEASRAILYFSWCCGLRPANQDTNASPLPSTTPQLRIYVTIRTNRNSNFLKLIYEKNLYEVVKLGDASMVAQQPSFVHVLLLVRKIIDWKVFFFNTFFRSRHLFNCHLYTHGGHLILFNAIANSKT